VAKVKISRGKGGYAFFKELGGAPHRQFLSRTAEVLLEKDVIHGCVLDYGCGHGEDADVQGWEAYDPYYRPAAPTGQYDTIIVNHVLNILTRKSRTELMARVNTLLAPAGNAYISVARNIPITGKRGTRQRIQNYVVLTLPSLYVDGEIEIYGMAKNAPYELTLRTSCGPPCPSAAPYPLSSPRREAIRMAEERGTKRLVGAGLR
jgi:hypothetical protein